MGEGVKNFDADNDVNSEVDYYENFDANIIEHCRQNRFLIL